MDPAIPFGGFKRSGIGREPGREHVEAFFKTKAVVANLGRVPAGARSSSHLDARTDIPFHNLSSSTET
jgi:hypothetical protein